MNWQIAQINVAIFRLPRADPVNADFEAALDQVNALAEAAPGFIWRMTGEGGSHDPGITINMRCGNRLSRSRPSPTAT